MVDWLRSIGLEEAASAISTNALYGLYQVAVLAAVWIPYLLLVSPGQEHLRQSGACRRRWTLPTSWPRPTRARKGTGGCAAPWPCLRSSWSREPRVYAFNTYLAPAAGAGVAATKASSESEQLTQQAR